MYEPRMNYSYREPLWYYLREYWIPILIALAVIGLIAAVVYSEVTREYYPAPVEACQRQPTGRTQTSVHMQCQPIGNNACAYQIPITTVYREFEYTCAWRSME